MAAYTNIVAMNLLGQFCHDSAGVEFWAEKIPSECKFYIFGTKVIHMHGNLTIEIVHKLLIESQTNLLIDFGHSIVYYILPFIMAITQT